MPDEVQNENDVQGSGPEISGDVNQQASGTDESGSQQEDNLYAPYLEQFPESLRPMATEVFKKWDGEVTKRFQAKEAEYEPYKQFIDQWEPDALASAVQLAEALESNPESVIKVLAEAYGITPQQAAQEFQVQQEPEVNYGSNAEGALGPAELERLNQQEQLLRAMAERMLAEEKAKEDQARIEQENAEYDRVMNDLRTKYGQFDEVYVNNLIANQIDPEQAVQHWRSQVESFAKQALTPNANAPKVMSANGGTPSVQRDVAELSSIETRRLVEQMLAAAAAEQNG